MYICGSMQALMAAYTMLMDTVYAYWWIQHTHVGGHSHGHASKVLPTQACAYFVEQGIQSHLYKDALIFRTWQHEFPGVMTLPVWQCCRQT